MKLFLRFGNVIVLVLILILAFIGVRESGILSKAYNSNDFDLENLKSDIDYDFDGIDDYTDILNGAKKFIAMKPKYKSVYYDGGYPGEYYVCTDLIWYALNEAGYDFKSMIDKDIKENQDDYDIDVIDSNIDFRRVRNIKVFLDKYTESLTTDGENYKEFQPGDIVVYKDHIALVSDKRNKSGISYIIHHDGYHKYEEDGLLRKTIIGHYRWVLESETEQEETSE